MEKDKDYQKEFIREGGSLEGSAALKEFFRTGERQTPFEQNQGWEILFGQEISSLRARVSDLEEVEKKRDSLKITRPHVEPVADDKEVLFKQLHENINRLLSDFENLVERLNRFMELKATLADLNKGARKWGNVYLLRSIIIFYDSIKHAYAEDIDAKQCDVIKDVAEAITKKTTMDRDKYRRIYKKMRSAGFRIIPEPAPTKEDE